MMSEGEEEGRAEHERLGDDVGEARIRDRPGSPAVEGGEDAQIGPEIQPLRMAGIGDERMGRKIGEPA